MKFSCPRSCRLGTLTTVSAGVRLVVDYRDADTAKKMQPEPPKKGGSGQQKNRLRLNPKSGGSGSATLYLIFENIL